MCLTHLLGVYCDGVFLYLHVMTSFVYVWEVYCFYVSGTFLVSLILICFVFFNMLTFLRKGSVCALLYVLI